MMATWSISYIRCFWIISWVCPDGLMGNSEVGHLNIGAGRVMYQDIVRINMDVKNKKIKDNPTFVAACDRAKTVSGGRLHLLGLISDYFVW
uniref:Uncharacterized protein n=1 Tax=Tetranychus urticae TaxID=32264 RepID=T1KJ55_TETUR